MEKGRVFPLEAVSGCSGGGGHLDGRMMGESLSEGEVEEVGRVSR